MGPPNQPATAQQGRQRVCYHGNKGKKKTNKFKSRHIYSFIHLNQKLSDTVRRLMPRDSYTLKNLQWRIKGSDALASLWTKPENIGGLPTLQRHSVHDEASA